MSDGSLRKTRITTFPILFFFFAHRKYIGRSIDVVHDSKRYIIRHFPRDDRNKMGIVKDLMTKARLYQRRLGWISLLGSTNDFSTIIFPFKAVS